MTTPTQTERQKAWLLSPPGRAGTGAIRYAAAMYFYAQGQMPAPMLEIYRRCLHLDAEDPVDLARYEGVVLPDLLDPAFADQSA